MNLSYQQFRLALEQAAAQEVVFILPDGEKVPAAYHITELGLVQGYFIDCGGALRQEQSVQLQLWLGADVDHRLGSERIQQVLDICEQRLSQLPVRFSEFGDQPVVIQYGGELAINYQIRASTRVGQQIHFLLDALYTQCLALERAKGAGAEGCCAPGPANTLARQSCCG